MQEEYNENLDSLNEEEEEETEEEGDHQDTPEDSETVRSLKSRNRRMFRRLKKLQGFVEDDSGNWTKPEEKTETPKPTQDVSDIVRKQIEEGRLEEMEESDEMKAEIKKLADLRGVSVRQAAKDPYILYKKESEAQERKVEDGGVGGTRRSGTAVSDTSQSPKFDLSTDEGRKQAAEWRKEVRETTTE